MQTGTILAVSLDGQGGMLRSGIEQHCFRRFTRELALNRPSDPTLCQHGFLHISSFVSHLEGSRRTIRKIATHDCGFPGLPKLAPSNAGRELGWLATSEPSTAHLLQSPWGLSFASDGSLLLTSHAHDSAAASRIVRLESCGCAEYAKRLLEHPPPTTFHSGRYESDPPAHWCFSGLVDDDGVQEPEESTWLSPNLETGLAWELRCFSEPMAFSCGRATEVTSFPMKEPNYVLSQL